jgi:tRNA(Leu) C34 or U34 (ribose-2'-O)-methylase TrmL
MRTGRPARKYCTESRLFFVSTRGGTRFDAPRYRPGDAFVFGPETRGLPPEMLDAAPPPEQRIRLPMVAGNRSLNLSNAVAVMVFEAWRQNGLRRGVRPFPASDRGRAAARRRAGRHIPSGERLSPPG